MTLAAVTTLIELGFRIIEMARGQIKDLPDVDQIKVAQRLIDARLDVAMAESQAWNPAPPRQPPPEV